MQSTVGTAGQVFKNMLKGVTDDMQMCIQNCMLCYQTCEQMVQHCLTKGGLHAEPSHIRLMQDCAAICATSAEFMMRGSDFHMRTCMVCAEICQACATDCRRLGDDEMMMMCADVCQRCADSCKRMSAQ